MVTLWTSSSQDTKTNQKVNKSPKPEMIRVWLTIINPIVGMIHHSFHDVLWFPCTIILSHRELPPLHRFSCLSDISLKALLSHQGHLPAPAVHLESTSTNKNTSKKKQIIKKGLGLLRIFPWLRHQCGPLHYQRPNILDGVHEKALRDLVAHHLTKRTKTPKLGPENVNLNLIATWGFKNHQKPRFLAMLTG